jgi:hypothetical protein
MFRSDAPAIARRLGWVALVLAASVVTAEAQQPQAQQAPATRLFQNDAGMVLDFEAVMAKLKEALAKSEKPERKKQAASWKVFKGVEPAAGGNVLYVFFIDPAVKDVDYTVSTILSEAFPTEVNDLFKKYADSYASGQNFLNLSVVQEFGK